MPVFHATTIGKGVVLNTPTADGGAGAIPFTDGAGQIAFADNLFFDDANDRVGIGTSSPTKMLDLGVGSDSIIQAKEIGHYAGGTVGFLRFSGSSGGVYLENTNGGAGAESGDIVLTPKSTTHEVKIEGKLLTENTLTTTCPAATDIGQIVKAAAAQTANLSEWQNSSGTVLAAVEPSGRVRSEDYFELSTSNSSVLQLEKTRLWASSSNFNLELTSSNNDTTLVGAGWDAGLSTYLTKLGSEHDMMLVIDDENTETDRRFIIAKDSVTYADANCLLTVVEDGNLYLGSITASSPAAETLNATGGSGTDIAGADFNIGAGKGTGAGASGKIKLQLATPGTTGSSLNTLDDSVLLQLNATDEPQFIIGNGSTSATPQNGEIWSTGGSGTDIAAGHLQIHGGQGTGTGNGGNIELCIAPPGTTGSSANATQAVLVCDGSTSDVIIGRASSSSANQALLHLQHPTGETYATRPSLYISDTNGTANTASLILSGPKTKSNSGWTLMSGWDDGTNRRVYFGGGGWGNPDATAISFYTAAAYNQTNNAGLQRMELTSVRADWNRSNSDFDYRVRGQTDNDLIYVDAANDRVGISEGTPLAILDMAIHTASEIGVIVQAATSQTAHMTEWQNSSGTVVDHVNENARLRNPCYYQETDGATVTFDLDNGRRQYVVLDGNRTLAITNDATGDDIEIHLLQDGVTGNRTVTWWAGITWEAGSQPTLATAVNQRDVVKIVKTGAGAYLGWWTGQFEA